MTHKIKSARLMLALLLAVFFHACKVSKDLSIPETGLPATYRGAVAGLDTTAAASLPWQNYFADTALKKLISDALAHNNGMLIALKNIEAANLVFKQAKLGNIPAIGFQATAATNRPSDNSLNGLTLNQFLQTKHVEDYTAAVSLTWEADIWGKIRSQKASALAGYLQTIEARKAVQTRLISDVASDYYQLLMLDTQLEIAQRNVLLNDSTLHMISLQYNAGQVSLLAVQQAEAQKLTAENLVPQFEQQITVQENAISILCGVMPGSISRSSGLGDIPAAVHQGAGVPSELLSRRPDVRQAELALTKANADVGYAKANLYPSLSISAQGGIDAFKASNWFNIPASLFGAAAGSLTQPLFQQKKLRTQFNISVVNRDRTVIEFRQAVLVAVEEVSDALVKLDKLQRQQELAAARTNLLNNATKNSQMLFNNGLANYLEVITAQGSVLQSELELASVKKERLNATVELYRSLGGGAQQ